jgi:hypothetical protein
MDQKSCQKRARKSIDFVCDKGIFMAERILISIGAFWKVNRLNLFEEPYWVSLVCRGMGCVNDVRGNFESKIIIPFSSTLDACYEHGVDVISYEKQLKNHEILEQEESMTRMKTCLALILLKYQFPKFPSKDDVKRQCEKACSYSDEQHIADIKAKHMGILVDKSGATPNF